MLLDTAGIGLGLTPVEAVAILHGGQLELGCQQSRATSYGGDISPRLSLVLFRCKILTHLQPADPIHRDGLINFWHKKAHREASHRFYLVLEQYWMPLLHLDDVYWKFIQLDSI